MWQLKNVTYTFPCWNTQFNVFLSRCMDSLMQGMQRMHSPIRNCRKKINELSLSLSPNFLSTCESLPVKRQAADWLDKLADLLLLFHFLFILRWKAKNAKWKDEKLKAKTSKTTSFCRRPHICLWHFEITQPFSDIIMILIPTLHLYR